MNKNDWENAYRLLIADGRQRLGVPPTEEEILALASGQLSDAEAANLRERISLYPDLARVLAAPFPDAEEPDNVVQYPRRGAAAWRVSTFIAAALAITFAWLLYRADQERDRLGRLLTEPQASLENVVLSTDVDRGTTPAERRVSSRANYLLLIPVINNEPSFPDYRVDLFDVSATPRLVWSATGVQRHSDNTFEILVPRTFLEPHKYRIVIQGLGAGEPRELARYAFHYE
jgi:hypothetical protein